MALDPNDDFGTEKCWMEMTTILSEDMEATLYFFESECTDEEFYWLGSVFEDVAEKTQSKEWIQVLRNRLARVTPETYHQQNFQSEHMRKWVDYAEYVVAQMLILILRKAGCKNKKKPGGDGFSAGGALS